jgi:hypothetical protein
MLHTFADWYKNHLEELKDYFDDVEFEPPSTIPTDKDARFIDFHNECFWGRITVWDSGEIDAELLETENAETVFYQSRACVSPSDLLETLNMFLKTIISKTGSSTRTDPT